MWHMRAGKSAPEACQRHAKLVFSSWTMTSGFAVAGDGIEMLVPVLAETHNLRKNCLKRVGVVTSGGF